MKAWRREVFLRHKIGGFDSRFDAAEDYDYWQRARKHFQFVQCTKGVALAQRLHGKMGSREFSARQEIAAAQIRARGATGAARRRILAAGFFNAAWNEASQNRRSVAWSHLVAAWRQWPFDARIYKTFIRLLFSSRGGQEADLAVKLQPPFRLRDEHHHCLVVRVAVSFLITPVLVRSLGERSYGMWIQVTALIGVHYTGFRLRYFISWLGRFCLLRAAGPGDDAEINGIVNTSLGLYVAVGAACMFVRPVCWPLVPGGR